MTERSSTPVEHSESHNPYVGIQRTVFEQGWQRALNAMQKRLTDDAKLDDSPFNEAHALEHALYLLGMVRRA